MADLDRRLRAAIDTGDTDTIDRIAEEMDAAHPRPRPASLAASALWYAASGLAVFPLRPGQKVPMPGSHGCKDATTDEATVRAWWAQHPDANIGIATGGLVDVIDIDGPIGVKSWASMSDLPPVIGHVCTPRPGGNHLYVVATGDPNAAGIFPGVDYRGRGGYVVAPPSVNAEGTRYEWVAPPRLDGIEAAA